MKIIEMCENHPHCQRLQSLCMDLQETVIHLSTIIEELRERVEERESKPKLSAEWEK